MLSTKGIQEGGKAKTLSPGKHTVKLHSISLGKGYEEGSYNVYLHVEGPDMGPEFEGFFKDKDNQSKGRYAGQVGRVRLSPFPYKDGVTKSGIQVFRDQNILRGLKSLSKALGLTEELDKITANTIEEFVEKASNLFATAQPFNIICGGKQYEKGGYTQYDLFVPNSKDGKYGFEAASVDPKDSKLMTYDPALHIQGQKAPEPVQSFDGVPAGATADANADFDLF